MQPEHAHLDQNPGIPYEPRVSHEHHIKEIAHAALSKIPGAKQIINQTFNKKKWKMPFTLPSKRYVNQAMYLGWA